MTAESQEVANPGALLEACSGRDIYRYAQM